MTLEQWIKTSSRAVLTVPAGEYLPGEFVTDERGTYYRERRTSNPVDVEVRIDGVVMEAIINRAMRNTSKRSRMGAITVRVITRGPVR